LFSFAFDELVDQEHDFGDGQSHRWMVPTRRAFERYQAEFRREFDDMVREARASVAEFRAVCAESGHPNPEVVIGHADNAIHSWTWDDFRAVVSAFYEELERKTTDEHQLK
jgi:hypothetical protein